MAEFCLDCWNRINKSEESAKKYVLSKEIELCEGCGQWKMVIVADRKFYYLYKFRYFTLPFRIIYRTVYFFCRLLILPYLIYKYKNRKDK